MALFSLCVKRGHLLKQSSSAPPVRKAPSDRQRRLGGTDAGFISSFCGQRRPAGSSRRKRFWRSYSDSQLRAGAWVSPEPESGYFRGLRAEKLQNFRWGRTLGGPRTHRKGIGSWSDHLLPKGTDLIFLYRPAETTSARTQNGRQRRRAGGELRAVGPKVIGRRRSLLSTRTGRCVSSWRFAASASLCPRSSGEEVPSGWEEEKDK